MSAVLSGRIPDAITFRTEVDAWRARRNIHNARANWHFTTADARVKLKNLYPALQAIQALEQNWHPRPICNRILDCSVSAADARGR